MNLFSSKVANNEFKLKLNESFDYFSYNEAEELGFINFNGIGKLTLNCKERRFDDDSPDFIFEFKNKNLVTNEELKLYFNKYSRENSICSLEIEESKIKLFIDYFLISLIFSELKLVELIIEYLTDLFLKIGHFYLNIIGGTIKCSL